MICLNSSVEAVSEGLWGWDCRGRTCEDLIFCRRIRIDTRWERSAVYIVNINHSSSSQLSGFIPSIRKMFIAVVEAAFGAANLMGF